MNIIFPILKGTQANYDAIPIKDNEKIYITTDEGHIYLGDKLLSESSSGDGSGPVGSSGTVTIL